MKESLAVPCPICADHDYTEQRIELHVKLPRNHRDDIADDESTAIELKRRVEELSESVVKKERKIRALQKQCWRNKKRIVKLKKIFKETLKSSKSITKMDKKIKYLQKKCLSSRKRMVKLKTIFKQNLEKSSAGVKEGFLELRRRSI